MLANFIVIERLIHSFKTAIACSMGYLLARAVGQPADQWIVITIAVVMCAQIYVGGILLKSYLRLLGTLMGCLAAVSTIYFLGHSYLSITSTIALTSFFFSYIATSEENWSYMGTLGAVTTIIILFGHPPNVAFAVTRFLEISTGIVIAALVSQFIFPIHARKHLRRAQAATLTQLRDFYETAIVNRKTNSAEKQSMETDELINKSLIKQRTLAKDSARELIGKRFDPTHFARSLYCEREMLRAVHFMDMAFHQIKDVQILYANPSPLAPFNQAALQALTVLIRVLRTNQTADAHIHLPQIAPLSAALREHTAFSVSNQNLYIDGFLFSAEVFIRNMHELATLYQIPVSPEPLPSGHE